MYSSASFSSTTKPQSGIPASHQGVGGYSSQMMTATILPPKLLPSLRMKTNELFYKWFSEPERHEQIKEIITYMKTTGKMPKITDLKTFKETNISYFNRSLNTSTSLSTSNNESSFYANQQHQHHHHNNQKSGNNNNQSLLNNSSSNNNSNNNSKGGSTRSKSPPSMQSPPMSPIGRMPNSPKSPKQRQNLMMIPSNGGNNSNQQLLVNNDVYPSPNANQSSSSSSMSNGSKQQPNQKTVNSRQDKTTTSPSSSLDLNAEKSFNDKKSSPTATASSGSKLNNNKPNEREIQIQRINTSNEFRRQNSDEIEQLNEINKSPQSQQQQQQQQTGSTVKTISSALTNLIGSKLPNNRVQQVKINQLQPSHLGKQQQQVNIPQFYFPHGKPDEKQFKGVDDAETMKLVNAEFRLHKEGKIYKENFADLVKLVGLPRYWKILLFRCCTLNTKLNYVTYSTFEQVWSKLTSTCHDKHALFMKLIVPTSHSIQYEDWEPLMQDIVDTHPGLRFLHDHKEFHTRYIKTVIARIYYTINRSWSGKITLTELKRSNFLSVLESLELEEDINLIKDYFSYEHFYVIYCKFWELDKDHDLFISKEDLYRHNNYAISARVIDRIFSGTVIRNKDSPDGLMSYYDFVWFLISEEDKRNPTSVEYWFRILDLDGDGVLSMYELEYFYNEQIEQMRERQIEYMPFTDLLCQILDLVKPTEPGKIRLKDLKLCKMSNVFFDTFINLEKYLEYEQRDPFSNMRDLDTPELSDWEKYAADEYENLVSEDVNGEPQDCYNNYDDDFEDEPLLFNNLNMNSKNLSYEMNEPTANANKNGGNNNSNNSNGNNGVGNGGVSTGLADLLDTLNEFGSGKSNIGDSYGGGGGAKSMVGVGNGPISLAGDFVD